MKTKPTYLHIYHLVTTFAYFLPTYLCSHQPTLSTHTASHLSSYNLPTYPPTYNLDILHVYMYPPIYYFLWPTYFHCLWTYLLPTYLPTSFTCMPISYLLPTIFYNFHTNYLLINYLTFLLTYIKNAQYLMWNLSMWNLLNDKKYFFLKVWPIN